MKEDNKMINIAKRMIVIMMVVIILVLAGMSSRTFASVVESAAKGEIFKDDIRYTK